MIPVKNIFYMLAYAFQVLNEAGYKNIALEEFDNVGELCAEILCRGIAIQIKRGLGKEYVPVTDTLSSPRGKFNISESIKTHSLTKRQVVCTYDNFTTDNMLNRILKATMYVLIRAPISVQRKKRIKSLLPYFDDVQSINPQSIDWHISFNRNNQSYQMLISICYLVNKGLIQSTTSGDVKFMDFLDEQRMCRLYEKFLLEYFRREHPDIHTSASQIPWQVDDGFSALLPVMQTDITLERNNTVLIIDAKYYQNSLQTHFANSTLHSGNLYQIFTYVKNKEASLSGSPHCVSGMLLYAKPNEENSFDLRYSMSGNTISAQTLNLNCKFPVIREHLDSIITAHFCNA